ncbi:putative holin-like toxin [Paenibacillus spongiae]|uniref:Holin-like toxin n=1 Tax=Paenibacillus spongiae TaxID=2909671 RepID=A0ABY5S4N6_9BACL|nr:putative holin-like toxin [Paenibacillus spongiae]UVI28856.1 putative holin-like toxin [Paenibacillus spongiae]
MEVKDVLALMIGASSLLIALVTLVLTLVTVLNQKEVGRPVTRNAAYFRCCCFVHANRP